MSDVSTLSTPSLQDTAAFRWAGRIVLLSQIMGGGNCMFAGIDMLIQQRGWFGFAWGLPLLVAGMVGALSGVLYAQGETRAYPYCLAYWLAQLVAIRTPFVAFVFFTGFGTVFDYEATQGEVKWQWLKYGAEMRFDAHKVPAPYGVALNLTAIAALMYFMYRQRPNRAIEHAT